MKTKKELTADYKRQKFPMGVLQIRNTVNGRVLFDAGLNLPALENRHRFQLDLGVHPNAELQADWKLLGGVSFRFEVVSELSPREEGEADYREELEALKQLCLAEHGVSNFQKRTY